MSNFVRGFLFAALSGCAVFSAAQQPPAAPLNTHQLATNVYWVDGGVSNSGIIVGDKGVIVVDTKMTQENGKQLLDEVARITPKPVTTVILTHRDMDHVGGLPAFPKGIEIIAHDVVPNKLPADQGQGPGGPGGPGNAVRPPPVQPTRVITSNKEVLDIDGVKIELLHWAPAHTSGDTIVYLPAQKIVFAGDILALDQPTPLIHEDQNGSASGWLETTKGMVTLDADRYVPGHGTIQSKQDVQSWLNKADDEYSKVKAMVAQGKSLAEIEAAVGDPPPSKQPARQGGPRFSPFSEVIYNELTKK
jgi:glyoxylase-like metal-dependent hydrolase (beta-lactamase superfamily II)